MKLSSLNLRRLRIALLSAAMGVLTAVGVNSLTAQPSPAAPAEVPATGPAGVAEMKALYDSFEHNLRGLPRDRFDAAAVTERVGREADALAAWVRDSTDPIAYRGALRGATGVLMDRAGNSLDRSILLAEVLQSAGYETRLANAALPPEMAQKVLALATQPRKNADAPSDVPQAVAAQQRVKAQADKLLAALGTPAASDAEQTARLAAVADHWWVQRQQNGQWVDVDLYGLTSLTPARTVPMSGYIGRLPLEAADLHEVEFRAVIEVFRGGKLVTETVLKHTLRPADVLGKTISFTHSVGSALAEADMTGEPAATQRLKAKLAAQETYVPILWIDERSITEASFTTSGVVDRHPQMDPAGKLGGTVTGVFGGGLLGGGGGESAPAGVLTAEWMEYEIRVPGSKPTVIRRPVFDLVGPAARAAGVAKAPTPDESAKLSRALLLMGQTQVLIQPCELSPMFALYQQAKAELRDKPLWLSIAAGGKSAPQQLQQALQRLATRDVVTPTFAVVRQAAAATPGGTYVDRPNIIHHRDYMEVAADGAIVGRSGMDLAYTSTSAAGANAFAARVTQGVADTLAEHLALGDRAAASENTVAIFETAAAPTVVRPGEAAKLAGLNVPPDAAARASADLQAGQTLVLASAAAGRWTWWRVDPATGQTVGVMDSGYHQSLTEQEAQYEKQLFNFNQRLKTNIDKDTFLNMKPDAISKWANNKDMTFNLQGLQKDWWGLIARRVGYAKHIAG